MAASKAKNRSRKSSVSKKRRTRATKQDGHPLKAGERRIVERAVGPGSSDLQMMHRLEDELEELKTA